MKKANQEFTEIEIARLIRMGWEDRTTFENIKAQFGLTQNQFIKFMRTHLDKKTFDRWRKRTHMNGNLKQERFRGFKPNRFKCSRQSDDGITKGWK